MLMSGCRDYVGITAADVSYVVCNDRNDRSGSGKVIQLQVEDQPITMCLNHRNSNRPRRKQKKEDMPSEAYFPRAAVSSFIFYRAETLSVMAQCPSGLRGVIRTWILSYHLCIACVGSNPACVESLFAMFYPFSSPFFPLLFALDSDRHRDLWSFDSCAVQQGHGQHLGLVCLL
jgi:hypothetical protein